MAQGKKTSRAKPASSRSLPRIPSKRGHGKRLTLLERYEICNLRKLHPDWSIRQLAATVGATTETVNLTLLASAKDVVELMAANGHSLLDDWRTASTVAALRGDHRPAKDWMMHSGLIDPLPDNGRGSGVSVVVVSSPLPGIQAPDVRIVHASHTPQMPTLPEALPVPSTPDPPVPSSES